MKMTEQEIIEYAKQNEYCWAGLQRRHPEVAAWMIKHKDNCAWIDHECKLRNTVRQYVDGYVYRLRPDYEPEQEMRSWFEPATGAVREYIASANVMGWLEVTPEYAEYLRNKPEGEWELQIPTIGDIVRSLYYGDDRGANDAVFNGVGDRGYRWCKVEPKAGWRVYEVKPMSGKYRVVMGDGYAPLLSNAANLVGFGGVQFGGHKEWSMAIAAYIKDGTIYLHDSDEVAAEIAVPVRARFREVAQ
jgi:hypothetical protein